MGKATGLGKSEKEGKAWGHGQYANMPHEVVMEQYPKCRAVDGVEDDTINGIDDVVDRGVAKVGKYMSNQK